MNAHQFIFWLNGFFDIEQPEKLDKNQTKILKKNLDAVLNNISRDKDSNNLLNKKDHSVVMHENSSLESGILTKPLLNKTRFKPSSNNKRKIVRC